jgi:hypothetical protein
MGLRVFQHDRRVQLAGNVEARPIAKLNDADDWLLPRPRD